MPSKGSVWMEGDGISWVKLSQGNGGVATKSGNGDTSNDWGGKQLCTFRTEEEFSSRRMGSLSANE
jgi:hypothetical protein